MLQGPFCILVKYDTIRGMGEKWHRGHFHFNFRSFSHRALHCLPSLDESFPVMMSLNEQTSKRLAHKPISPAWFCTTYRIISSVRVYITYSRCWQAVVLSLSCGDLSRSDRQLRSQKQATVKCRYEYSIIEHGPDPNETSSGIISTSKSQSMAATTKLFLIIDSSPAHSLSVFKMSEYHHHISRICKNAEWCPQLAFSVYPTDLNPKSLVLPS